MKNKLMVLVCIMAVILGGCATMLAPSSDNITIKTNPEGANVFDGANLIGKTPLTYNFKRETFDQKKLNIKMHGYKSQDIVLLRTIEKKALYNLVFITTTFGVTSWGIDAANGNMIKYSPDSYLIDLEKTDSSSIEEGHTRIQRFRFVILNQDYFMQEIAYGGGEYLRGYFESRPSIYPQDNYQDFLNRISNQSSLLLSIHEPIYFFNYLEKI